MQLNLHTNKTFPKSININGCYFVPERDYYTEVDWLTAGLYDVLHNIAEEAELEDTSQEALESMDALYENKIHYICCSTQLTFADFQGSITLENTLRPNWNQKRTRVKLTYYRAITNRDFIPELEQLFRSVPKTTLRFEGEDPLEMIAENNFIIQGPHYEFNKPHLAKAIREAEIILASYRSSL